MSVEAGNAAGLHVSQPVGVFPPSVLPAYQWVWANAAARLAQSVTAAQKGGVGYQIDMDLEYELLAATGAAGGGARWGRKEPWGYQPICKLIGSAAAVTISAFGVLIGNVGVTLTAVGTSSGTQPLGLTIWRTGMRAAASLASVGNYRAGAAGVITPSRKRVRHIFTTGPVITASQRYFVGLTSDLVTTNVDPNTFLNSMGIGRSSGADANWQLYHNNGAGLATKTDTGLPTGSIDKLMEWEYWTEDGTSWGAQVTNLSDGGAISYTLVAPKIPLVSSSLVWSYYTCNNAQTAAHGFDFVSMDVSSRIY